MAERYLFKNVLPFPAMVTMECINVGLNTLFKAATEKGMSRHVFIAYNYAVAALVLLPSSFISQRSRGLPPLNFSILSKIAFLGLIGASSQIMGYTGINYSSPTLASAISNLVPAFTFILAILFRMEKLVFSRSSSQAKVMGTIISITGAFVVTFYKGPRIIFSSTPTSSLSYSLNSSSSSSSSSHDSNWVIGSFLLTGEYILVPLWYIVQTKIMKEYPDEVTVIFFYNSTVTIIATIVGLFSETDSSAWILKQNIAFASVLCSGLFGSCLNNTVHSWALRLKGPVFVAMFKPLSIVVAIVMGILFLGDALYLGSLIGASIISIGFYTVMWGKAKEEIDEEQEQEHYDIPNNHHHHHRHHQMDRHENQKVPLLESYKTIKIHRYVLDDHV